MKLLNNRIFKNIFVFCRKNYPAILILLFFFICYSILPIVKHFHYLSGYDLSVIDQATWKYAHFKNPISTTHVYFDTPIYFDHVEIIFLLIAPLYWIFDTVLTLIALQTVAVISSGFAVYLLAKHYKLKTIVSNALLITYLSFYGIQFAIWSDVHSIVFGIAFLSWFLYFLTKRNALYTYIFLILAITSKEDVALLTLLISTIIFITQKNKTSLISAGISVTYLLVIFLIFFPMVLKGGYRFANPHGILSDINIFYFVNTPDKQKAIFYSFASFGFLPLLAPFYLIPFVADLGHYFVLGNAVVSSAQGLFAHYRSSVALLLSWPTIIAISKIKKLNSIGIALYLIVCAFAVQYILHLPLSYLSKSWFWSTPPEVNSINKIVSQISPSATIVTQNNIAVHLAHRDELFTLFPYFRDFKSNSPCKVKTCRWFRVGGNPQYLLIDTGPSWNILHLLATREDFSEAIGNLEKNGNIKLIKTENTTKLFKIIKKI